MNDKEKKRLSEEMFFQTFLESFFFNGFEGIETPKTKFSFSDITTAYESMEK